MAVISSHKLCFTIPKIFSPISSQHHHKRPSYPYLPPRFSDSAICRCCSRSDSPEPNWRSHWESFTEGVKIGLKYGEQAFEILNMNQKVQNPKAGGGGAADGRRGTEEEWDWDRWRKHFEEVDEQADLVLTLKSQLARAVYREDYKDAAMLKVAIAAAAKNDIVGKVMSNLNRAVEEERYQDAAFIRDYASAGLVGWWSGISDDSDDPYGLIVRITAEHGRYVARSYSPRQLSSAAAGVPLFEVYLTKNKKGEYKQQVVYLMQHQVPVIKDSSTISSRASGVPNQLNPSGTEDSSDVLVVTTDDIEDADNTDDGYDAADGLSSFQNILRDMIPGAMVKVSKETASGKVDRDFMSKMIEDLVEEEDEEDEEEEEDIEIESEETDDEIEEESDQEKDEIEIDVDGRLIDNEEEGDIAVKIVVSGLAQKLSSNVTAIKLLRMPAKLDKKGRLSFSFSIENYANDSAAKEQASRDRKSKLRSQRSLDSVIADLAKFIGNEKRIPMKVLKDVGELISLTLSLAQNRQPLSGSTNFSRIEIPASSDPLNGLYIGSHGLYTSEVIHLRRKFGYWQEDGGSKDPANLEFYEYVEAMKLTGDPYVPAGQVAFRAKIGKRYQVPHKGVIPEEFGVIARYKGQGRLAEPGFQNPRWVDGELFILDGKYLKGGPVLGFLYWAPEYHFLVLFNRLRLQQ